MQDYWDDAKLMFQRLAIYDGPALVQLEPDFWGYTDNESSGDASAITVRVTQHASDCSDLNNDLGGMGRCLVRLARMYAPKARVGFHLSRWGNFDDPSAHGDFLVQVGASEADFVTVEMLDRDAGCFEVQASGCQRNDGPWYWDVTNNTSPNFDDHIALVSDWQQTVGTPVMWWQVPMGVPSDTMGGTDGHYRDNRVKYMFDNPAEFAAIGGFAMVFGEGATGQTTPATDNGQFNTRATEYLGSPVSLP
jgi:hypothetical protein